MLSKRILDLKKALEIKPWKTDVKMLLGLLEKKAFVDELEVLKKEVLPTIHGFSSQVITFSAEMKKFE